MEARRGFLLKIFKNLGFGTIAVLASKITQLALFVLIARWLGAEGLGQYTLALSVALLIGVLSDLGISQYVVSQVAATGQRSDWYLSNTFSLRLGLSLLGLMILLPLGLILNLSPQSRALLYLIGIGQFFVNVTLGWRWIFQAQQKLQYEALLILIFGLVYSLAGIGLLLWKRVILWIGVSYLLAGLAFFIACRQVIYTRFGKISFGFDLSAVREILKGALPMTLTVVFMSIYLNADTILLTHFQGEKAAGFYNASNRLIQQLRLIPALLGPAFLPALTQLAAFEPGRLANLLRKGLFYLFTLFLPVTILVSFAAGDIINLLYGVGFSGTSRVLAIQIWSALCLILYAFVFNAFMALKKFKALALLSGVGALLNLILNLTLIPRLSFVGPAYAILFSELMVLLGTLVLLQKYLNFGFTTFFKRLLVPAGAGLGMVIFWVTFPGLNWIAAGILSLAVYVTTLLLAKGIPGEDWQVWRSMLSQGRTGKVAEVVK